MLSIGKLGQGQATYYLETVARGVEDYYTGAGEAPGRWAGSAARDLDVGGEVDGDALHAALDGAHPLTGDPLAARRGGTRVPGFDLTFSAPKSVSVVFGLGHDDHSAEISAAHDIAVDAALGYIERHAAVARRGAGGANNFAGNGFLAAAFRHRSSRAGDPQLHTHVLVANMTKGPDGRWTALDGRRLYAHAKTAGYLYQAQLRSELVRRLGVEWGPVHKGSAEIAGIPQPVLRAFSRRRAEIEGTLAERGEHSHQAARVAALDTRRAKDYGVEPDSLRLRWGDQARRLGFDRELLDSIVDRARAREPDPVQRGKIADALASPHGLTQQRSSFTRRDVVQAFCERVPDGADVAAAERFADSFLASEHAVVLATDVRSLTHHDVIQRGDGRVVAATAEERRHSTPELLTVEKRLIEGTLARRGEGAAVVSDRTVDAALSRRSTLGSDQAEMVRRLTQEGDGVQLVTGKAGTGKTFALDAAREAWEAEGHRVIGAAVARRAARELEDGAGIESTSLAALLQDLRMGGEYGLPERGVVVLDEAGMVGSRQLAELLGHAAEAEAKVVLVGDPHQLPEIDAGGAFRALLTRTDPIALTENRRQREVWERDALDDLREGRSREAIERYQRHGRIVLGEGAEDVRERLVDDWWRAAREGDAVMVALRRADVADLNARARALMRTSGQLGSDALHVGEREFAVGDQAVALKNARSLGIVNGTRGVITSIDREAGELALRGSDGRELRLPRAYLESQTERCGPTLDHGYAITGHKAQGMTTGSAFVLGTDDLYREWGYVAMSRGRDENRLYVVAPRERERDQYAPAERRLDPLAAVLAAFERSEAQTAAIDVAVLETIGRMTTVDLLAERAQLAERIGAAPLTPRRGEPAQFSVQRADLERAAVVARKRAEQGARRRFGLPRRRNPAAVIEHIHADDVDASAQALAARQRGLEQAAAGRSAWLNDYAHELVRYSALGDELERRRAAGERTAVIERPEYLITELGTYPERRSERQMWERAAMRIEAYRQEFGVEDSRRALGGEPRELRQRSARRTTQREVDEALRSLRRGRQREKQHEIELGL